MYRIFCESYANFIKTINEDSYRIKMSEPLKLIVDISRYDNEKKNESKLYKKLCDLMFYMQENINRFPKLKAFLWTLESRDMKGMVKYNISTIEELEEQTKLINSLLKLAYWY